jgi:ribosomal protein S18 acetylase RimI-like enzyme
MKYETFTMDHYFKAFELWKNCEGVGLSSADEAEPIRQFLERNPGMSFCAIDGDRVVGTVLCGNDGRRGYLHHLAVATTHRRQGIGNRLVLLAMDQLRRANIQKCHLFIFKNNEEGQAFWIQDNWKTRKDLQVMSKDL